MIQIGGVYTTFCQEERICKGIAIEMGGVSRYFSSKVSGLGVDSTLLNLRGAEEKEFVFKLWPHTWIAPGGSTRGQLSGSLLYFMFAVLQTLRAKHQNVLFKT